MAAVATSSDESVWGRSPDERPFFRGAISGAAVPGYRNLASEDARLLIRATTPDFHANLATHKLQRSTKKAALLWAAKLGEDAERLPGCVLYRVLNIPGFLMHLAFRL